MTSSMVTAGITFTCVFGGALLGMSLRAALPEHHLNTDSKDVVKLTMALIASMAALVLSLLIASTKSSYDMRRSEITQLSASVVVLDRMLAHYGPETAPARNVLRGAVATTLERIWPEDSSRPVQLEPAATGAEVLYDELQKLSPQSDAQRSLQAQALKTAVDLGQTRWLLFEQSSSSIPMPFLVLLVFWLTILFTSFGLFAPRNPTVIAALLVGALSVSGAVFLVLELDEPFRGLIQISSAPLRSAAAHLGQ